MASGFYKALIKYGYVPGEDIHSVSFDRVDAMDVMNLKYDYVEHDDVQMGRVAAQMLMDHFEGRIESRREYVVPARLIQFD